MASMSFASADNSRAAVSTASGSTSALGAADAFRYILRIISSLRPAFAVFASAASDDCARFASFTSSRLISRRYAAP